MILEDPCFGIDIGLKASVAVKMIRRDVQHHRDLGMEGLDGLELKTRNFENVECVISRIVHQQDHWCSDVAANKHTLAGCCYEVAAKSRGCGFAIGAGNRNDPAFQKVRGQLDFSNDRQTQGASPCQLRNIGRNSGTNDNQVLIAKGALAMATGLNRDSPVQQGWDLLMKLLLGARIRDGDARATRLQKECGGHAGLAKADHQHALALYIDFIHCRGHCDTRRDQVTAASTS